MSLFDSLKNAIFGHKAAAAPPPAPAATAAPAAAATPAAAPPSAPVDIEAVLNEKNAKSAQKLNWQTSIVDLMKLVGMDSSFANRKQLATELGYTGDSNDSASMNIWLHKEVMKQLAASGGKVPASLLS
jgi:3-oxoacyl-ACP reductase-like protein